MKEVLLIILNVLTNNIVLFHILPLLLVGVIIYYVFRIRHMKQSQQNSSKRDVISSFLKFSENTELPMAILELNHGKLHYINVNQAYATLTGRDNFFLMDKTVDDIFEPVVVASFYQLVDQVIQAGKPIKIESILYKQSDEGVANLYVTGISINQKYELFIISYEDITNYKYQQEKYQELSNRFSLTMRLSKNIAFVEVNQDTKMIWASDYFFSLLEVEKPNHNALTYREMNDLILSLQVIINEDEKLKPTNFFRPGLKMIKCVLPKSNVIKYFEIDVISDENVGLFASLVDVTDKVKETNRLKEQLKYDVHTGFLNRDYLNEEIQKVIKQHPRHEGVLYFFDIDNFKKVNNRYGHEFGDLVIKKMSEILQQRFSQYQEEYEIIGSRKAGDEFLIYLHKKNASSLNEQEILHLIGEQVCFVTIDHVKLNLRFNVGIARYSKDTSNINKLINYSDFALHQAKKDLLKYVYFFNKSDYEQTNNKNAIIDRIETIIRNKEWYHVYQPILDFESETFMGYEALTRPYHTNIQELISIAYEIGVYKQLERSMYFSILEDFGKRNEHERYVSINEGPHDIFEGDPELLGLSTQMIKDYNIKTVIEITEYMRMDILEVQDKISRLKVYKAEIAIDDFGSGYSNELALLSLNPTFIKVDRGLIENIDQDERKQLLVSNIVRYANKKIVVIAEGVETKEELEKIIELGIDGAQGYYIAKPSETLEELPFKLKKELKEIKEKISLLKK